MKNNCPYCHKNYCVPESVFLSCEHYGYNYHTIHCTKCNKIIEVCLEREVIVAGIIKSNKTKDEVDWPPYYI